MGPNTPDDKRMPTGLPAMSGARETSPLMALFMGFFEGPQALNAPQPGMRQLSDAPVEQIRLSEKFVKTLVVVSTQAWKLKSRMTDPVTGEVKDDQAKVYRHVETMLDSLAALGIQIRDRTNEGFDYGLPEKVVGTQPTPGLTQERVIETIKPTIYFQRHMIQIGEVVLGVPPKATDTPPQKPAEATPPKPVEAQKPSEAQAPKPADAPPQKSAEAQAKPADELPQKSTEKQPPADPKRTT